MKLFVNIIFATIFLTGCNKYLDLKPDKRLVTPTTTADLRALLEADIFLNAQYPNAGAMSNDNFYLTEKDWMSLPDLYSRDSYVWAKDLQISSDNWLMTYKRIFYANVILDNLDKAEGSQSEKNTIHGMAKFYRGYSLFKGAEVFCQPYHPETAASTPGMPIKLTSDINDPTVRATLAKTYEQIISDLLAARNLLPEKAELKTHPTKAAASATLASLSLLMGQYSEALSYSEECLKWQSGLIDFNNLDQNSEEPIPSFNIEVIFHCRLIGSNSLYPTVCRIEPGLLASYALNDLRKIVFYAPNIDGSYTIKSCFDGPYYGILYSGISTDEIWLTKAEALCRLGKVAESMIALNTLASRRYNHTFTPFTANTAEEALSVILIERRKELAFRGNIRWNDLRRLNLTKATQQTITRNINNTTFTLLPNDRRYTMPIPTTVINQTGISQNER